MQTNTQFAEDEIRQIDMTTDPVLAKRALTAAEFRELAEVPPAAEWFANLDNANTRRSYQNDLQEFMRFVVMIITLVGTITPASAGELHQAEQVRSAIEQWSTKTPSSYSYDLRYGGDMFGMKHYRVTFQNGTCHSKYLGGGTPRGIPPIDDCQQLAIPHLMIQVQRDLSDGDSLSFDSTYGYISAAHVNGFLVDNGWGFQISKFKVRKSN